MENTSVEVGPLLSDNILDMAITVYAEAESAKVRIAGEHTNIILIEKNGKVIFRKAPQDSQDIDLQSGHSASEDRHRQALRLLRRCHCGDKSCHNLFLHSFFFFSFVRLFRFQVSCW